MYRQDKNQVKSAPAPLKGKYRPVTDEVGHYVSDSGLRIQLTPFVSTRKKAPALQIFVLKDDGRKVRVSGVFKTSKDRLYKFDSITATGKIEYFLKLDEGNRGFQIWAI